MFSVRMMIRSSLISDAGPDFIFNKFLQGSYTRNEEKWLTRTASGTSSGRRIINAFRDEVRQRDRGCVITGQPALGADVGYWKTFGAAHVFPVAYQAHWIQHDYSRWISVPAADGEAIHSMQNGLLLRNDIHDLFDSYDVSINPDV